MDRETKLTKLGDYSEQEKEQFNNDRVKYRQEISRLNRSVRKVSKDELCAICKKPMTSFCNSHSIPAMCLRRIAENGIVYRSTELLDMPVVDSKLGVNNAGTFQTICKECDSIYFKGYEDIERLKEPPTQRMMCEIAIKDYLKAESTSRNSINTYALLMNQSPGINFSENILFEEKDQKTYANEQCRILKILENINDKTDIYTLLYFDILDYVVPVAFQNRIALFFDFHGRMINDPYNPSPKYMIQDIHICIFPLKSTTVLMLFYKTDDLRYRSFRKAFQKLQRWEKISVMNYIILCYSEECYYSPSIHTLISSDNLIISAIQKTPNPEGIRTLDCDTILLHNLAAKAYNLSEHSAITNLLSLELKDNSNT